MHDPAHPTNAWRSNAITEALQASEVVALIMVDQGLAVQAANPAAVSSLGEQLCPGTPLAAAVALEDVERLSTAAAEGSRAGPFLLRSRATPEDEHRALLVSVLALGGDDGRFALIGRSAAPDLKREARILRARRFEIVGQLTSGVAHDLNNRLSTVTTFSDLMLADAEPGSQDAEDLAEIKNAGLQSAVITRKLDLFAGGHAGGATESSVSEVVRGFEKLIRRFLGSAVQLVTELDAECPPVPVPPIRIEEMLIALVANARDAMAADGTLTIRVRNHTGDPDGHPRVRLEVIDTGTDDTLAPIGTALEPFFSTKVDTLGSGLGLTTVHGLLRECGGAMSIERSGASTQVVLTLPALIEETALDTPGSGADARSPASNVAGRAQSFSIALVEPDPGQRSALVRDLERDGLAVTAVGTVGALLASGASPRVVVADVEDRPGAGAATVAALRALGPEIPVLLLRRRATPRVAPAGVPGVLELAKPADLDSIREALAHLVDAPPRGVRRP